MREIDKLYKVERGQDYMLWRYCHGDTIEIVDIAVYSERLKGVGRSMFNELDKTKTIYAFCRSDNEVAHKFYQALGFKGKKLVKFYQGSNAHIYIHESSQ